LSGSAVLIVVALVSISAYPLSRRRRWVRIARDLRSPEPAVRRAATTLSVHSMASRFAPQLLEQTERETDPLLLDSLALDLLTTPWRWSSSVSQLKLGLWAYRWAADRGLDLMELPGVAADTGQFAEGHDDPQ
jgi:hypothetical protein